VPAGCPSLFVTLAPNTPPSFARLVRCSSHATTKLPSAPLLTTASDLILSFV
jgi:hypothetical protein